MKLSLRITLGLACLLVPAFPIAAREPLVDKVKKSISDGVRYLRDLENGKGNFEHTAQIALARPGGVTALAVVALLNAGVPVDDALIQRCLKYLRTVPPSQTYTIGLQTMAFCLAGQKQDRELVQKNLQWLVDNRTRGGWGYDASIRSPDHSINQYALLGIHEARLAGFKIDPALLRDMHKHYNDNPTGQWQYRNSGQPALTMTTAGLCNLLITAQDIAGGRKLDNDGIDPKCGIYSEVETVKKATDWVGRSFPNDIQRAPFFPHAFYTLYGIERAGRLTGQRFFDDKDWYRVGCEYLVATQKTNGSWSRNDGFDQWPPVATSFALLFLSKGRTPILISKLTHGVDRRDAEPWNTKRHDVRHVVDFCSRELFEKHPLAWQVFDVRKVKIEQRSATQLAEDLLQGPIVYITGHELRGINEDSNTEKVLKEYIENGGFILGHACCGGDNPKGQDFDEKFRELIQRITGSKLGPLGRGHPVATSKFKVDPDEFGLEGVNKGCKTVVIYVKKPISGWWENNDSESEKGKKAFQMAANIVAYATGMELPKPRLTEVEIVKDGEGKKPPRGYLQVGQLVPTSDAVPLAPKAIPNLMAEVAKLDLEVNRSAKYLVMTSPAVLKFKFLYMHDRNAFNVPQPANLENLRFSLEHDGILLADAACGSKRFDRSFRELIEALWPKDKYPDRQLVAVELKANQARNELYSREVNGQVIESVKYRREEKDGTPSKDFQEGPPRLEGVKVNGRWVVIYSKYDIGCALEKHQSTDCLGHDHDSARLLARAVVLYALRR